MKACGGRRQRTRYLPPEEAEEAIKEMKEGKTEGVDEIAAELWKRLNEIGRKQLVDICQHTVQWWSSKLQHASYHF